MDTENDTTQTTPDTLEPRNSNGSTAVSAKSRKTVRKIQRKRRNKRIALWTALLLVLGLSAGTLFYLLKPETALSVANMFPEETTDFRTFSLDDLEPSTNPEVLKALTTYGKNAEGEVDAGTPRSAYVDNFLKEINSFNDFRIKHEWVAETIAHGSWENGEAMVYAVNSRREARKFMESPECDKSIMASYCGEGNYIVKNHWLIVADGSTLSRYQEDFEKSLADNSTFASQTANILPQTLASIWTSSSNITSFLPLGLDKSLPVAVNTSVSLNLTDKGIAVTGSFFKGESDNPIFDKKPMADSMLKIPENTVMAVSVSEAHRDIQNMLNDPESFINTQDDWKALRGALEGYGVVIPDDLEKIFGSTTTFSLNEGTVGNKVAGTLRIHEGDSQKAIDVLANASKENDDITDMYKLKEGDDDLLIESHSPITDGTVVENPLFNELVGGIDNSLAVAFVDFDSTRELLNSDYKKPTDDYDKGVMGMNLFSTTSGVVDFTVNWKIFK